MSAIIAFLKNETLRRCVEDQLTAKSGLAAILSAKDESSDNIPEKVLHGVRIMLFDAEYAQDKSSAIMALTKNCAVQPILIALGETSKINPRLTINRPFKFGRLLDVIDKSLSTTLDTIPVSEIDCKPFGTVDVAGKLWRDAQNQEIALTDKEIMLFYILSQSQSGPLSKDILYKSVWGFSAEIETHTLETHIYRLRQKIEADPSKPDIIKTYGDRYALASHESA